MLVVSDVTIIGFTVIGRIIWWNLVGSVDIPFHCGRQAKFCDWTFCHLFHKILSLREKYLFCFLFVPVHHSGYKVSGSALVRETWCGSWDTQGCFCSLALRNVHEYCRTLLPFQGCPMKYMLHIFRSLECIGAWLKAGFSLLMSCHWSSSYWACTFFDKIVLLQFSWGARVLARVEK